MTICNNLKKFSKAANLTQEAVAEQMGIKPNTYCAWEAAKTSPSTFYVPKLAAILKVDINDLFAPEANNQSKIPPSIMAN